MENNIKELAEILKKLTPQQTAELSMELGISKDDVAVAKRLPTAQELRTFFIKLGAPINNKGFDYLVQATLLTLDNPAMLESITKELYPEVAKRFGTTPSRVERAIRHAIEVAWDRGDIEVLQKFFGYTVSNIKGKPTNSEFIAMIADCLSLRRKQAAQ